ncbi:hypothetical protein GBA65_02245 [Rubrobacter marinus]|uniref:Uncharacterized protein n=1 Tax=Rubrobacter marinus TaxID=2653852 RepID=A0A6G8PTJ2_9ACTN|nr:hypothetical protein [Rubrobacter marinus]QIN77517.1 hypothetical protein GBA65_02245 [Rubrobacter marinus]
MASASMVLGGLATHASRTMMLAELSLLLEAVPAGSSSNDYARAVTDDNVLLKAASSTRKKTLRHLRELYALDERDVTFGILRKLWEYDPPSRPLLALLMAITRDGLLRTTVPVIVEAPFGDAVDAGRLSEAVGAAFSTRLTSDVRAKVGRNTASSWTQSGHLKGRAKKVRVRAGVSAGAVVFALILGHLHGVRGLPLYDTVWSRSLDASGNEIDALAFAASQRGWMEYRRMGEVAEFGFSKLLPRRDEYRG